jgi:large subunit ribosomal protein L19
MTNLLVQDIGKKFINKKMPILRPGYHVRVHQKIKEGNKERIQVFEGMVIGMNAGNGPSKTFTVRKIVQGIGVEKIFPIYSPKIAKIEVKKTFKVRRGKLTYLRDQKSMSKRLSAKLGLIEKDEILRQKKGLIEEQEATMEEAVKKAEVEEAEAKAAEEKTEEAVAETVKAEAPKEDTEVKTEAKMQDEEIAKEEAVQEQKPEESAEEKKEAE